MLKWLFSFLLYQEKDIKSAYLWLKKYLQEGMINCGSVFPAYPNFVYLVPVSQPIWKLLDFESSNKMCSPVFLPEELHGF